MTGTTPIVTSFLIMLFFRRVETVTSAKFIGALIGLVGICVIFYPQLQIEGAGQDTFLPTLALFGMTLCYGLSAIWARIFITSHQNIGVLNSILGYHCGSLIFVTLVCFLMGPI